jgi:hypothetical protein
LVCNPAFPTVWSPRFHPDCPPPCTIDGVLYPYNTVNPDNPCQRCRGGSSWSPSDALFCDDAQERACCNGACCNPGECCTEAGTCGSNACESEGCTIDGVQHANGTVNPDNVCQRCDETVSKTTWSPNGIGHCGPNGDQWCCDGVCCALGDCCNQGVCDPNLCPTCAIDGVLYTTGDRNPANGCQVCDDRASKTSWSLIPANNYCDDNHDRVCCVGICCGPGQVCVSLGGDHCGTL